MSSDATERERRHQPSWQAVSDQWSAWRADGSLEKGGQSSLARIRDDLDWQQMTLDGRHAVAKKGGQRVAYQARKRAKTSPSLPSTDTNGYGVASTGIVAGNHKDAFNLKTHLQTAFKTMKDWALVIAGAFFNADSAFDTKAARKVCFNHQVVPNMAENKRNRQAVKRGRKRRFNAQVYKDRLVSERSFAWIDKFRALLIRFDLKDANVLAGHHLAFAFINLRHLVALKV